MLCNRTRRSILALALAFALPLAHAQSVGSAFTYQGELRASGTAATAAFDFQFRLYNSAGGSTQLGAQVTANAVAVTNGLFSVPLDFGPAQFAGDAQWLEISVRPAGSGTFETLSPRTAVTATPYALGAVAALANSVTTTSIVDGSVQFSDVSAAQFQARVTGTCTGSQGIQSIGANGTVVCGTFGGGGGTITGVAAGTGLTGGGTSGAVTLSIAAAGVGAAQVNADQVQRRVSGTCPTSQYVRIVNQDGTVVCGVDAGGAAGWGLTGNAGTNPATNFVGTSDDQPLVLRAQNVERARLGGSGLGINGAAFDQTVELSVRSAGDNQGNIDVFANLLLEPQSGISPRSGILVSAGGGTSGNNNQGFFLDQYDANLGQVRRLTLVGNGRGRFAGSNLDATADNAVALGGDGSRASGVRSAVVAGSGNQALGVNALVGGQGNCAGGDHSFAGGRFARVRIPTGATATAGCSGVANSADADGDEGSFVWGGSFSQTLTTTAPNQFLVRAEGGAALNGPPLQDAELTVNGKDSFANLFLRQSNFTADTGGFLISVGDSAQGTNSARFYLDQYNGNLAQIRRLVIDNNGGIALNRGDATINPFNDPGALVVGSGPSNGNRAYLSTGGTWTNTSSRLAKEAFADIDVGEVLRKVLAMSVTTWSYKGSDEGRHMGPVAEDFYAAFGLGGNERAIATVDSAGVALAAIQGLHRESETARSAQQTQIDALQAENASLRERLERLEARLERP